MFDYFNVNHRKNEGFLTFIPIIPIPEYGQSNAPLKSIIQYNEITQYNDQQNRFQVLNLSDFGFGLFEHTLGDSNFKLDRNTTLKL